MPVQVHCSRYRYSSALSHALSCAQLLTLAVSLPTANRSSSTFRLVGVLYIVHSPGVHMHT